MKAIFAGTFDPFTLGHKNIVERALDVFGSVTVAVAVEKGKSTVPITQRTEIAKQATADLQGVTVESFDGLLTDYVKSICEPCVLVRGVRSTKDLEYERDLTRVYIQLCGVQTVFIMPDAEYEHISSTTVRALAALGGELDGFVEPRTKQSITRIYGGHAE